MTTELFMLAATAALLFVLLVTHGTQIALSIGVGWGVGRRDTPPSQSQLGRRIERTIINQMESMAVFVPLVLVAHLIDLSTPLTVLGAQLFFWARLAFAALYISNIPYLRTGAWLIAIGGMALFIWEIFLTQL